MSLPRYGAYRNSGISWISELPAHWNSLRIKTLFELMKRPPRDEDGVVTAFRDGQVTLRSNRRTEGFTNSLQEIGYQGIRCGDLVIHAMDAFAGAIGVSDSDGKSTPVYSVCKPRQGLSDSHYYGRLLRHMALSGFVESLAKGIRERSTEFRWAEAGNVYLPVPPIVEQTAIVAFLDRETAQIDALIAEQEKLIALLAEKRKATISHAVTKGLNPNAPMKNSGVAWMGEVPAHWSLTPLARIALDRCDGPFGSGIKSEHYRDEGALVVRLQNIRAGTFNKGESVYLDKDYFLDELQGHDVVAEDLLIAGLGDDNNLLGRACVAPSELGLALVKADCFRFRLNTERAVPYFVAWQLSSGAAYDAGVLSTGTTRSRIPLSVMASRKVALPPHSEQEVIAKFIASENEKLDTLTAEASLAVVLLRERRSALIAAAVTGQIDVRDAMPQTIAESPEAMAA